jgi:beta-glucosidase/6-phospho-beta-glucosidase/beta-galactosidase
VTEYQDLFKSFFMGGFECASHRRRDDTRIDVIAKTSHDVLCALDYHLLASAGIRTVRDGLRWHLIESAPGNYNWSSLLDMLHASHTTGTQVIWDLCHWGIPDDIDIFSAEFPLRFAAFAAAAATWIHAENLRAGFTQAQVYCPINEISFWAWVGGDEQHFHPFGSGRGPELKRQLVLASLAAIRAVRAVDPTARFLQAEPIIHISADEDKPEDGPQAARHTESQFEAWDMLAGVRDGELGGSASSLDLIGINYYWNNQWIHEGDRTPPGHAFHRPLHDHLFGLWQRYGRPILIAETGAEGSVAAGWLGYIAAEVRQAIRLGVPVVGICIYPIMDYPGWDDDRHCSVGLLKSERNWKSRSLREDLVSELKVQSSIFAVQDDPTKKDEDI